MQNVQEKKWVNSQVNGTFWALKLKDSDSVGLGRPHEAAFLVVIPTDSKAGTLLTILQKADSQDCLLAHQKHLGSFLTTDSQGLQNLYF